jgi:lysozyme family protein
MDNNFERAMDFVLKWEGGYVNDPNDPGGETNFGISKRANPDVDIKNLTRDQAITIYRKRYWDAMGCGKIANPLDIVVMDTGVNLGTGKALEFLGITHDVEAYLLLRISHYAGLRIAKLYIFGWTRRVISLWNEVRGL